MSDKNQPLPEIPKPNTLSAVKSLIKEHGLAPGSDSYNRQLIGQGIKELKDKIEFNSQLGDQGLNVNDMTHWIHRLVRDTTGGVLFIDESDNSTKIRWDLNDGCHIYNLEDGNMITCEA